ncbi:fungal hydrophobin [Agrocybe pediades]|nr:fungal hydrophobin [Agrocybe pediades]
MKFTSAFTYAAMALPILAAANELEARDSCNTGVVQCCQSLTANSATDLAQALGGGLLGLSLSAIIGSITGTVGVNCSPLSLIGVSGNTCSTQPVCCTNNFNGGLIQAGCTPINVGL